MTAGSTIRVLLGGAAALALSGAAASALADGLTEQYWDEIPAMTEEALGDGQLGTVVGQPSGVALQAVDARLPTEDQMTPKQKAEKEQLESGVVVYVVEIPPEQRVPGGPTHRTVEAPAPFGGTDAMIGALTGETGMAGQLQSTLTESIGPGSFTQGGMGSGGALGSMLADGITGALGQ